MGSLEVVEMGSLEVVRDGFTRRHFGDAGVLDISPRHKGTTECGTARTLGEPIRQQ